MSTTPLCAGYDLGDNQLIHHANVWRRWTDGRLHEPLWQVTWDGTEDTVHIQNNRWWMISIGMQRKWHWMRQYLTDNPAVTNDWENNILYMHVHDDVIKWKHFLRYWLFVWGIHRSPVNSPHKGHWRGALMFSLICAWINGWVNNQDAGNLRRHRAHYDVILMPMHILCTMTTLPLFNKAD